MRRHWTHTAGPPMLDKADVAAALDAHQHRLRAQLVEALRHRVDLVGPCALCNVERAVCDSATYARGEAVCHPCGRRLIDTETELALCGHPLDFGAIR